MWSVYKVFQDSGPSGISAHSASHLQDPPARFLRGYLLSAGCTRPSHALTPTRTSPQFPPRLYSEEGVSSSWHPPLLPAGVSQLPIHRQERKSNLINSVSVLTSTGAPFPALMSLSLSPFLGCITDSLAFLGQPCDFSLETVSIHLIIMF